MQKNKILTISLVAGIIIIGLLVWFGLSKQQASPVSTEETTQASLAAALGTIVPTENYKVSYTVSPDERKKDDPITITLKIQNKDGSPVENAKVVLDMAMKMEGEKMGMEMGEQKTMKMIATYEGGDVYIVQDKIFYEAGNFYEVKINDEKVGEMTVKPAIKSGWEAVETSRYSLSYKVTPEEREVGNAIEITVKLFDGANPVEKTDVIWDMAMMKKVDGDWQRTGTMKMLSSYMGDGIYKIQDQMFYEVGNFYEIVVDGEKIGETTVMPTQ